MRNRGIALALWLGLVALILTSAWLTLVGCGIRLPGGRVILNFCPVAAESIAVMSLEKVPAVVNFSVVPLATLRKPPKADMSPIESMPELRLMAPMLPSWVIRGSESVDSTP